MADVATVDSKRPTRIVVVAYLLLAVVLAVFFEKVFGRVFALLRINDADLLGTDSGWTTSGVIGVVVAAAVTAGAWMHLRLRELSFEVASELKKCSWPNAEDTRTSTIAVVVFSFFSAGVMGFFDFLSSKIMTEWIPGALDAIARHI